MKSPVRFMARGLAEAIGDEKRSRHPRVTASPLSLEVRALASLEGRRRMPRHILRDAASRLLRMTAVTAAAKPTATAAAAVAVVAGPLPRPPCGPPAYRRRSP